MEQEKFFSGYCRTLDNSRMVCAAQENGALLEVDCSYESCPFTSECTIAQGIIAFLKDN
ncbi:MAG: hypothetical protein IJY91_02730 [Oscillospiraceae bacterium]|nr:hypothetical protein [Oscillospiraceae bacterium]